MSLKLCDVLTNFHPTRASEILPCAPSELRMAVTRAKLSGYLEKQGDGLILTQAGQAACGRVAVRHRKRRKK